jgi:hypothetical protein
VFLRLVTLTLAQSFDLVTFMLMTRRLGPSAEANPLVSAVFEDYGLPAVALAKLALVVLVGGLVVAAAQNRGTRRWAFVGGLPLALAIAVGLIGGITNASTFLG